VPRCILDRIGFYADIVLDCVPMPVAARSKACGNSSGQIRGREQYVKLFSPQRGIDNEEKMSIFAEFTILVTGHGKLRSYLYRFGING
jgi:hypothetical protein